MEKFREIGISEELAALLEKAQIREPTEIQEKTIPLLIEGKDVIAASHTGSGKTLAFGLVMIQNIQRGEGIQGLVLTPTRELALQVSEAIKKFASAKKLKVAAVYGGTSITPQIRYLESADIVVGTPGRLLDHINRRTIDLRGVNLLVLDEADMMLDMGFLPDVERIISRCPKERQTLLFSATMPDRIIHLSKKYLHDAVKISTVAYVDPKKLKQIYYEVNPDDMKFSLLSSLLKKEHEGLIMVFCNTRRIVDSIADNLKKQGINAVAIHGGLTQSKRDSVMGQFHSKKAEVLVCTDVAARGLDISGVSHVYNYDTPKDNNDYVHRIGRTARAGKEGMVINLITRRDFRNFKLLQRELDIKITQVEMPNVEKVNFNAGGERRGGFREGRSGGFRGGRSGGSRSGGFRGEGRSGFRSGHGGRFSHRDEGHRPESRESEGRRFEYSRPRGPMSEESSSEGQRSESGEPRTGGYNSGYNLEERGERREGGFVPRRGFGRRDERSGVRSRPRGRFAHKSRSSESEHSTSAEGRERRRSRDDGEGATGGRWGKPKNRTPFRKSYRKK